MSINLLDVLTSDVGSKLLGPASKFLGESESATNSALGGLLPSILGGLMDKGSNQSGAGDIMDMFSKADPNLLSNVTDIFSGGSNSGGLSSLLSSGSGVLGLLFGNNKLGSLIDLVTSHSGMKKSSSSTLIKLIAPFVMSAIGGKVKSMGLDALGLSKLLGEQGDHVKAALPAGFGDSLGFAGLSSDGIISKATNAVDNAIDKGTDTIKDVSSAAVGTAKEAAGAAGDIAKNVGDAAVDTGKKGANVIMKWVLPAFLALLVLGFLARQGCNTGVDALDNAAEAVTNTTENVTKGAVDAVGDAAGAVTEMAGDALTLTGDALKGAFGAVNDVAKAALDKIEFAAGSIGDQMMNFINGDFSGDNRFTFTNLTFDTGSATIKNESMGEVDNLAAILNAYTGVNVIVEGHTDNTGSQETNAQLSMARAKSVKARLIEQGVDADRITSAGYGSANPKAPNDTPEGREQNRRIEVRIVK